jgi:hypothetical protein
MDDLIMNQENREQVRKRGLPNPHLVGFLMGIVALVAPNGFIYYPSYRFPEFHVGGAVWGLSFYATEWRFTVINLLETIFLPLIILQDRQNIPPLILPDVLFLSIIIMSIEWYFIGIRILFAYQTMRYFQGKTTRKRLFILGVLAELPYAPLQLYDILRVVIMTAMGTKTSIVFILPIPIPCMLVFCLLLFRYFPMPSESDWDLERETEKRWVETGKDSTKA